MHSASAQSGTSRRWPAHVDARGVLQVEAKFVRALLPARARSGGSAPTHIKLFAGKKGEVRDKYLL